MLRQIGAAGRPPLDDWQPPFCGDIDICIRQDGRWFHEGAAIGREQLVRLFASILRYEAGLGYVLVTPVEKWRIQVEDAPLIATAMAVREQGGERLLCFAIQAGGQVCADAAHPLTMGQFVRDGEVAAGLPGRPYIQLDNGLTASLSRPVYYQLSERVVACGGHYGVWSAGRFFPLQALQ